jgi:hypothetical protein
LSSGSFCWASEGRENRSVKVDTLMHVDAVLALFLVLGVLGQVRTKTIFVQFFRQSQLRGSPDKSWRADDGVLQKGTVENVEHTKWESIPLFDADLSSGKNN